jgi:hypothetical protein
VLSSARHPGENRAPVSSHPCTAAQRGALTRNSSVPARPDPSGPTGTDDAKRLQHEQQCEKAGEDAGDDGEKVLSRLHLDGCVWFVKVQGALKPLLGGESFRDRSHLTRRPRDMGRHEALLP